jgi:hypothetical protein
MVIKMLKISKKGMEYWEKLMDSGDKCIREVWEWNIREGFDWVDENEVKSVEELVNLRRKWLSSSEFEMLSGKMGVEEIERELRWFSSGLRWLIRKGWVVY